MKKPFIVLVSLLLAARFAEAGPDLKVERRTLDREDVFRNAKTVREELIRGLRIRVKNNGAKGMAEGEVEWAILVQQSGKRAATISSGTEKLQALGAAQMAEFVVGAVSIHEQRNQEHDMEYRVIVRQAGAETAKLQSTPHFDLLAKEARSVDEPDKPRKGKKP